MGHRIENLQYGLHTIHFECLAKTSTLPEWRDHRPTEVYTASHSSRVKIKIKVARAA